MKKRWYIEGKEKENGKGKTAFKEEGWRKNWPKKDGLQTGRRSKM